MNIEKTTSLPAGAEIQVLPSHQKRFLLEHITCPMCEAELNFSHEIDKNGRKVKEEAHCPQCGVRARKVLHGLH